jgi:DNA-binding Xre family transcriptional regulator
MANSTKAYKWFIAKYQAQGYASLNQFAAANGMQKSSLSRYFNLQRQIPSNTIGKLCKTLKVTPEELLKAIGAIK